jgi:hydroxyacylglutathione hydrolase
MEIVQIAVLRDNYIFLLHDAGTGMTAAVDPAEAYAVMDALQRRDWRLTHILNTHHHADHVGGNLALKQATGCRIVGHSTGTELIPGLDEVVGEGDQVAIGTLRAQVLAVPGHTRGHIAFWFQDYQALFCGDTLFGMGCGRLLGGTAEQLWASLDRLRQLPAETRIFCAHEYTQNNGWFALSVEPDNAALQNRQREVETAREQGLATVPSLLQDESSTNPFLRPESPEIRRRLGMPQAANLDIFTELRRRKDYF